MRIEPNPLVRVSGTGSYLPPGVVDNPTLSTIVKGYDAERSGDFSAWVDQMTHINQRRFAGPGGRTSDLARIAAERAMASAGVDPKDIGLVVYATFTPSEMIPGDHCVLALMTPIQGDGRSETRRSLIAVAPDGALKATYNELSEFFEGGGMRFSFGTGEGEDFTGQWDVDGAGRVYTAPMYDQYLLRVYAPDGKLIRRVLTDYEHLKRTKDEIAEIEERQAGLPEGFPRPEINPYLRDVRGIVVRPDGSVWVDSSRNSRRREAGAVGPFDRYDPQGRFVERVTLKADYDPERDDVVVAGDRLFVIKEAQMTSGTFQASSGAMNMVITMGGGDEEDEDEELDPAPLSVISYRLPAGY